MNGSNTFVRTPDRWTSALLEDDTLTFVEQAVMPLLVALASRRRRQVSPISLAELKKKLRWEYTPEHLRQVLRKLESLGEISLETRPGPKARWTITILQDDWFGSPQPAGRPELEIAADLQPTASVQLETISNPGGDGRAANPGLKPQFGRFESPTGPIHSSQTETETQETSDRASTTAGPRTDTADRQRIQGEIEVSLGHAASYPNSDDPPSIPCPPHAADGRPAARVPNPSNAELEQIVSGLEGADEGTINVLKSFRNRGLPATAFDNARVDTMKRTRQGRLRESQAAYYVGALKTMLTEGQYAT